MQENTHTRASKLLSIRMLDDLISLWMIRGWPEDSPTYLKINILLQDMQLMSY